MSRENLSTVIENLIASDTKASRKLPRGLILACTPGSANDGTFRFACSRRGVSPSSKEMGIVERDLKAALKKRERQFTDMQCQPWLKKKAYQYHLWEWRELVQEELL